MVCISHSLHKNEDCQLSQFWWDTLGPLPRGLQRCQQRRDDTAGTPAPGAEGRDFSARQQQLSSLQNTMCSQPEEHHPLLLDRLPHPPPKPSFCLSSSQTHSLDLTTEADNSVPFHTHLAPRRERIYSAQIRGFSLELCFSACNHYF